MSDAGKSRLLTVIDDDRGNLRVEFWRGLAFLHSTWRKPVAAMRAARTIFPELRARLKRLGHQHCYVAIPIGDEKLFRFERSFGFRELCVFNGHLIMAQSC